jgi:nicotinamide-nucleotide amidase
MSSSKVVACVDALLKKHWTIAFVESASAGRLSYEFSRVINSGEIFLGGLVCYHTCVKEEILDIPGEFIKKYTAESAEVTAAMATAFRQYLKADVYVALTGLTSPGGSETPDKPVGTIFIHCIFPSREVAERFEFNGDAEAIVSQAIGAVAEIIINQTK